MIHPVFEQFAFIVFYLVVLKLGDNPACFACQTCFSLQHYMPPLDGVNLKNTLGLWPRISQYFFPRFSIVQPLLARPPFAVYMFVYFSLAYSYKVVVIQEHSKLINIQNPFTQECFNMNRYHFCER